MKLQAMVYPQSIHLLVAWIEYFPSNYNLSFDQFDYEDLAKKISILQDKETLIEESKKINENINKYFSEHKYFENFRSIILE